MGCCTSHPDTYPRSSVRRRHSDKHPTVVSVGRARGSEQRQQEAKKSSPAALRRLTSANGLTLWTAAKDGEVETVRSRIQCGDDVDKRAGPVSGCVWYGYRGACIHVEPLVVFAFIST